MTLPRREQPGYKLGLQYFAENPEGLTAHDLAAFLGVNKQSALAYIKIWRAERRLRICGWQPPKKSGDHAPIYTLSPVKGYFDAPKPEPKSDVERASKYRQKMRAVIRAKNHAPDPMAHMVAHLVMQ